MLTLQSPTRYPANNMKQIPSASISASSKQLIPSDSNKNKVGYQIKQPHLLSTLQLISAAKSVCLKSFLIELRNGFDNTSRVALDHNFVTVNAIRLGGRDLENPDLGGIVLARMK
mmetsp:Transcript_9177/g.19310  ORF Transcript_9177/g.19310 Transcript_9177/m.19310 type:complete len:115 (-) Transcript_9177:29-373(-)